MNSCIEPGQLSQIAHGLNNQLTIIKGYTECAIAQAELDSRLHGLLKEIAKASDRAREISSDLLRLAAPKVGRNALLAPEAG